MRFVFRLQGDWIVVEASRKETGDENFNSSTMIREATTTITSLYSAFNPGDGS